MSDDFDALVAGLGTPAPRRDLALILTPIVSSHALAGLASMAGLTCTVVPSGSGAVAAMYLTGEEDPFEKLSGEAPREALALAKGISILTKVDVVLLVSRLGGEDDAAFEGMMSAWRISGEDVVGEISPGVIVAGLDARIEDLALGETRLEDVAGAEDSGAIPRWKAVKMFTRGLRKPQNGRRE